MSRPTEGLTSRSLLVVVNIASALTLGACASPEDPYDMVTRTHEQAEAALDQGRWRDAVETLTQTADQMNNMPNMPSATSMQREQLGGLHRDLWIRAAGIALEHGDVPRSLALSERALALPRSEDVWMVNAHIAHGRALRAGGHDVEATLDFEAAQEIASAILERLMTENPSE